MEIKLASWDHYDDLFDMVYKFVKEDSPYSDFTISNNKVANTIEKYLNGDKTKIICLVIENDEGKAVGMIGGIKDETNLSTDTIAAELLWYVRPDYRKSRAGLDLLQAFEYWAKNVTGADYVQITTSANKVSERLGQFLLKKNFKQCEKTFLKGLN